MNKYELRKALLNILTFHALNTYAHNTPVTRHFQ